MGKSPTPGPSKPSEPGFDGFEGQPPGLFPIIQGQEEDSRAGSDVIEKAGNPSPSKPSEHRTIPALPLVLADGGDPWPTESITAERRFCQSHAKLFPFLGRKVLTPDGPGTLQQVFADRVTVLLDSDLGRCAVFAPEEIRTIAARGDD